MATAVTTTAAQRKGATTVDYEAQPNACTALLVSSSGGQTAASSVSSATTGGAYENAQTVVAVSTVSDMDPDKARLGRKLNFCEFMLYNSLLFGMCFAKVGGPPIFACPMAGCCCMNIPPNFDVRRRCCRHSRRRRRCSRKVFTRCFFPVLVHAVYNELIGC